MNRFRPALLTALLSAAVFLTLLFSGCSSPDQNTAVLWTSLPEFAAYVEAFNAHQNTYRVMIVYKASPAIDLAGTSRAPDIVVGEYLRSETVRKSFSSLGGLLAADRINPASFYPGALKAGNWGGKQLLLPVSFDLPAIMFLKGAIPPDKDSFFVTLSELEEIGKTFNKTSDNVLQRVGFSPQWSGDFLYNFAALNGAHFREDGNGAPLWDEAGLTKSIDSVQRWIKESNGGLEADSAFRDRYLYEPSYVLLSDRRVEFAYTDISSFFQMDENKRQHLGFRWIADKERVPVLENMVFAGIPNRARNRGAADAFLRWFFQEKTQAKLLDESQLKQLTTFGMANGLSAMSRINELELPKHYPQLLGHIPKTFDLLFPTALPRNWPQIKEQVVRPWLLKAAAGEEATGTLREKIRAWLLQQGE